MNLAGAQKSFSSGIGFKFIFCLFKFTFLELEFVGLVDRHEGERARESIAIIKPFVIMNHLLFRDLFETSEREKA